MAFGLEIEEKYDTTAGHEGKIWAEEINKIVTALDNPMVVTNTNFNNGNGFTMTIDKLVKYQVYTEAVVGNGELYTLTRLGLNTSFDVIEEGMIFNFMPRVTNSTENVTIRVNTGSVIPVVKRDGQLNVNELVAGLIYTVLLDGGQYVIISGGGVGGGSENGDSTNTFDVADPETNMNAVNLQTLNQSLNELITIEDLRVYLASNPLEVTDPENPDEIVNLRTLNIAIEESAMWDHVIVDDDYMAYSKDFLSVDSTINGGFNITLPESTLVDDNDMIHFLDIKGGLENNPVNILRNGNTIMGLDEDMLIDTNNISFSLKYLNGDWRIV